jgi:hypothetical protein
MVVYEASRPETWLHWVLYGLLSTIPVALKIVVLKHGYHHWVDADVSFWNADHPCIVLQDYRVAQSLYSASDGRYQMLAPPFGLSEMYRMIEMYFLTLAEVERCLHRGTVPRSLT